MNTVAVQVHERILNRKTGDEALDIREVEHAERFGEVRGFSMSFPGTPVPDGGEVEVFDLLATMRDEVGTVAYAGTGNAVVSVNGIEIGLDAVYESTEAMSIGFDFEFEFTLELGSQLGVERASSNSNSCLNWNSKCNSISDSNSNAEPS